jgi:hypothetical protein
MTEEIKKLKEELQNRVLKLEQEKLVVQTSLTELSAKIDAYKDILWEPIFADTAGE